jgi:hypothetical protein
VPRTWNWFWLTLAFAAELAALVALGSWGFGVGATTPLRLLLGIGTPVAAAVLWGLFAAPRAPVPNAVLGGAVTVLVFGSAVLALALTGHPWLAGVLAVAAALSSVLSVPPDVAAPGVSGPQSD